MASVQDSAGSHIPIVQVQGETVPVVSTGSDLASATAGTATISYAAVPGMSNFIDGIFGSYSGSASTPSGTAPGVLSVLDGSTSILSLDVTSPGLWFLPVKLLGTPGNTMTITLATGGAGVIGKVKAGHSLK